MPREDYVTVSITKDLAKRMDDFLEAEGKRLGLNSRANLMVTASLDYMIKNRPRFKHINTYDDHATIINLETGSFTNIIFHENGTAWCDTDNSENCTHIQYALTVPSITDKLKEKGWKTHVNDK